VFKYFLAINMGTLPFKKFSSSYKRKKVKRVYVQEVAAYAASKFREWEPQDINNSRRFS
jgi:hypothetical protein